LQNIKEEEEAVFALEERLITLQIDPPADSAGIEAEEQLFYELKDKLQMNRETCTEQAFDELLLKVYIGVLEGSLPEGPSQMSSP
jgi:hypothetical protein